MTTYRVRGWDDHYETYESRRLKTLLWVAMPTKHDGKTFRRVMRLDPTGSLYGAWALIVQVAAKCPVRGTLADGDGPLTALDIADKTDLSTEAVQHALNVFSSSAIRWLETDSPADSAGVPARSAGTPAYREDTTGRTEQDTTDITEQDKEPPHPLEGGTGSLDDSPDVKPRTTGKRPPRTTTPKPPPFDPSLVPIPERLRVPVFLDAWRDWIAFRRKKRKPISKEAADEQLKQLAEAGPDAAVKAIRLAIANDWQGLFPKQAGPAGKPTMTFAGTKAFLEGGTR